jgi:hypothetical protein
VFFFGRQAKLIQLLYIYRKTRFLKQAYLTIRALAFTFQKG